MFENAVVGKLLFGSNCKTLQFQEGAKWLSANSSQSRLQSGCRWTSRTYLCSFAQWPWSLFPSLKADSEKTKVFFMTPCCCLCRTTPSPSVTKITEIFFPFIAPHVFLVLSCLEFLVFNSPLSQLLLLCLVTLPGDPMHARVSSSIVTQSKTKDWHLFSVWRVGLWTFWSTSFSILYTPQMVEAPESAFSRCLLLDLLEVMLFARGQARLPVWFV